MTNTSKEVFIEDIERLPNKCRKELLLLYQTSISSTKDFSELLKKAPKLNSPEDIKNYLGIIKRLKLSSLRYLYQMRLGNEKYNQLGINYKRSKKSLLSIAEATFAETLGDLEFENVFSPDDAISIASARPQRVRELVPRNKPPASPKMPSALRSAVWRQWVEGNVMSTKCYCCKSAVIEFPNFHCGHVVPASLGGKNTVDNLRPICQNCNLSMGNQNMKDFMNAFGFTQDFSNVNTIASTYVWVIDGVEYHHEEDLYVVFPWMFMFPKWRNIFEESQQPQILRTQEKTIKRIFYFIKFEYENWFARKSEDYNLEKTLR